MKPINKKLLCKEIIETTTKTGIILTTLDDTKGKKYKVIDVSDDINDIVIGDVVVCSKYAGASFGDMMIIGYSDILGIIK